MNRKTTLLSIVALCVANGNTVQADDWAQWNGPNRTGEYTESGVIDSIPETGLKQLWTTSVGGGYSGPAVADGRVFVTDYVKESGEITNNPGGRDKLTGQERILCFELESGNLLWEHKYARDYALSYPIGPRVTPTIDDERVYTLGAEGDLLCLNVKSGDILWQRQLRDEYETETPIWGYAAAPLIYDNTLITLAGGEGSIVVALDKMTGNEIWRALSASEIGYCPPTLINAADTEQLIIWDADKLNALNPKTGEVFWQEPLQPRYGMSIAAPIQQGNLLFASAIGNVGKLFELNSSKPGITEVWEGTPKTAVYCGNSTPVFDGDYIYGSDCGSGEFICVNVSTGEREWATFEPTTGGDRRASHGTAFITKHGDQYFLMSETGDFIIADLSPEKYEELGRFHVLDPTNDCFGRAVNWSYPAYADQSLLIRNDNELVRYSLKP
jgi:outer membrane protein assembly factor BamB